MVYAEEICYKIDFINNVLVEIGVPLLFDNNIFFIDDMSMESWLKINLSYGDENKIPLILTLTRTGLQISLDRVGEAIDWSNKDLNENKIVLSQTLKNLFVNYSLVEYYGPSITLISLFDQSGKCTNSFNFIENFPFRFKREKKLYLPIF